MSNNLLNISISWLFLFLGHCAYLNICFSCIVEFVRFFCGRTFHIFLLFDIIELLLNTHSLKYKAKPLLIQQRFYFRILLLNNVEQIKCYILFHIFFNSTILLLGRSMGNMYTHNNIRKYWRERQKLLFKFFILSSSLDFHNKRKIMYYVHSQARKKVQQEYFPLRFSVSNKTWQS